MNATPGTPTRTAKPISAQQPLASPSRKAFTDALTSSPPVSPSSKPFTEQLKTRPKNLLRDTARLCAPPHQLARPKAVDGPQPFKL